MKEREFEYLQYKFENLDNRFFNITQRIIDDRSEIFDLRKTIDCLIEVLTKKYSNGILFVTDACGIPTIIAEDGKLVDRENLKSVTIHYDRKDNKTFVTVEREI